MADAKTPAIYIEGEPVKVIRFPGGEVNVNICANPTLMEGSVYSVVAHLRDEGDVRNR